MNSLNKIKISILLLITIIMVSSFSAIKDKDFEIAKNLDIFYTIFREINLLYVDETDPEKMIKTAADAMLKELDPYTVYIPESRIEDFKFMTTGQYGGIGATIKKENDYIIIAEPYEGFPAYKAGLMAGDKILKIDGKDAKAKTTQEISDFLKGKPGSEFTLTIKRYGRKDTFNLKIKREKIQIKAVPYYGMLNDSTGYLTLSSFTRSAYKGVKEAINKLIKKGANSLVFDLRNNPGGLLVQAIDIANLFIEKGNVVVKTKGRVAQWNKTYLTQKEALFPNIPLVILVNSHSASASEIVSGTIQDWDRGVVLGERTFGKGLVQTTRPLSYNAQIKLTTAKYYIASGRCIQALDYSHRRENGSVGKIPDSLITKFETHNKRIVYDGGGILPDINITNENMSNITYALLQQNLIFKYATIYRYKNNTITNAKNFKLSNKDYQDFSDWLIKQSFEYESISKYKFDELVEIAKQEKYFKLYKNDFDQLKQKLNSNPKRDLKIYKSQIKNLLEQEIVTRYYYQKGQIENSLSKDTLITQALKILNNKMEYKEILKGIYKKSNIKLDSLQKE